MSVFVFNGLNSSSNINTIQIWPKLQFYPIIIIIALYNAP